MDEITAPTGRPIAFLQGPGNLGTERVAPAPLSLPFRPDSGLDELARARNLKAQDENVTVNRRADEDMVQRRRDIIDAEQQQIDRDLAGRRAIDAVRLRQELTGPDSAQAVSDRAETIQFLSDLSARQLDRAEQGRQFVFEQISAQHRAEKAIQSAAFDPALPRGSLVDIQA